MKTGLKKHVLVLTPFFEPNVGGVETYMTELCKFLTNNDYYVYVLTYQPLTSSVRGKSKEVRHNIEIYRYRWLGCNMFHILEHFPVLVFLYLTPYLLFRIILFFLIRRKPLDVIHAHGYNGAFMGIVLKKLFRKKVVVTTHALYNLRPGSFTANCVRWIFKYVDVVLPEAKEEADELIAIGVDPEKIHVVNYWIDHELFYEMDKAEAKRRLGLPEKFTVLFMARLIEIKGVKLLLEAARQCSKDIQFVFCGEGPLAEEIQKAAKENPRVLFPGRVEYDQTHLYYNAADVFAIPSMYDEGLSRSHIEAFSCGIPVIGSNRGCIPDINADVGITVEPTPETFLDAIVDLYKHPGKWKSIQEKCFPYAKRRFSIVNAEKTVSFYD